MTSKRWQLAACALFVASVIVAADTGWAKPLLVWVHSIPLGDKVCHAVFMGLLCWLGNRAFNTRPLIAAFPRVSRWTVLLSTLVVLEEVSQIWIPGRTFSLLDLLADFMGITVAVWAHRQPLPDP